MTTTPLVEVKSEIGIGERNAVGVNHVASVNEFVVVTNELASSEPSFPQQQRPRANSSIESADVQSVVAKAKRASSLLWMILHAKSCRLGVNSCQLRGCSEAKLVLLHLKTCPATAGRECPSNHNGCAQARKLLVHYDSCREIRMRKPAGDQHFCLVCSLVARHARSLLNGDNNGINHSTAVNGIRARFSSFDDENETNAVTATTTTEAAPVSITPGSQQMPPPPPRNPLLQSKATLPAAIDVSSAPSTTATATAAPTAASVIPALCESPPVSPASPLMSVATAASLAEPIPKSEPDASTTNNSDTTSQAVSWSSSLSNSSGGLLLVESSEVEAVRPRRRKRAETLDFSAFSAAQPLLALRHSSSLPRQFGSHIQHHHRHPSDPTFESGLMDASLETPYEVGYESDPNLSLSSSLIKRPRSLSCSVMMGRSSHLKGSCETIVEEASLSSKESIPINSSVPEDAVFYMDEDTHE